MGTPDDHDIADNGQETDTDAAGISCVEPYGNAEPGQSDCESSSQGKCCIGVELAKPV